MQKKMAYYIMRIEFSCKIIDWKDLSQIELYCRFLLYEKRQKKSNGKKVAKKTQEQYDIILAFMETDIWYKASDLSDVHGVKETRTKELLRALAAEKKLEDDGATKGRRYRKR